PLQGWKSSNLGRVSHETVSNEGCSRDRRRDAQDAQELAQKGRRRSAARRKRLSRVRRRRSATHRELQARADGAYELPDRSAEMIEKPSSPRKISVQNFKGGVGKTATV